MPEEQRIGIWFVGAWGGVATCATVGLCALEQGLVDETGLVTALSPFSVLGLAPWKRFVVGGHEARKTSYVDEAAKLHKQSGVFTPELLQAIGPRLKEFDWLHLHHEDFTGQYSKFYLNYSGAPWLAEMVDRNQRMARQLGFPNVPALKRGVAKGIAGFVENGGFLFAMCTATETLDLALASEGTDIAATTYGRVALGLASDNPTL